MVCYGAPASRPALGSSTLITRHGLPAANTPSGTSRVTSSNTVRVPAMSLASLIQQMPESPTALICDIEGAEQYLDFTHLPASVTKIIIELHPGMIGEEQTAKVQQQFASLGFVLKQSSENTVLLTRSDKR